MSSQKSSGKPSFSLLLFYLSLIVNPSSLDMSPDLCEMVSAVSIGEADTRLIDFVYMYIACGWLTGVSILGLPHHTCPSTEERRCSMGCIARL